jgi:hypothetical protein
MYDESLGGVSMEVEEIEALEDALAGFENEGGADSRPTVVRVLSGKDRESDGSAVLRCPPQKS